MVDLFASAYGWRRDDVLALYPEEVWVLTAILRGRNAEEELARLHAADWPNLQAPARRKHIRKLQQEARSGRIFARPRYSSEVERKMAEIRTRQHRELGEVL